MSELIGLSFDAAASPEIAFERSLPGEFASSGWGVAWYPAGELTAAVVRDPQSGESGTLGGVLHDWDRFRTTVVVAHLRGAAKRATHRDTHPFVRLWGGRSWVFAHDGDLVGELATALPLPPEPQFVPGGPTDTEHLFSWLLAQAHRHGARSLADLGYDHLDDVLVQANRHGTLNLLLSDGEDLVAHRDATGHHGLWWTRRTPPHGEGRLSAAGITADLATGEDANRSVVVVCSVPLSDSGWHELAPGETLVARRGNVVHGPTVGRDDTERPLSAVTAAATAPVVPSTRPASRRLAVLHQTSYHYDQPVERSSHRLRLTPVNDAFQRVLAHSLEVNCDGTLFRFEDVFGNDVVGFEVAAPFTELVVTARSEVEVRAVADRPELLPERHTLPLVWMPWQHQMMTPYLLPPELPEDELRELGAFALAFAERNRGDLRAALDDMTTTIFRDFTYTPGYTTLETTPYQVFATRAGVCQDFANLMICACRLLQIPARYRVGYIRTGADDRNTVQSEASHAWVEVYLPHLGWRGYDPTNGCAAGPDHVRVAAGRNYRDATPTAGVIRRGGGGEQLAITVQVDEIPAVPDTTDGPPLSV